jgi:O-antigen/teichoic acid export membrane protein
VKEAINGILRLSKRNALLSNSINLMTSAGITAIFGFVFWTAVAHTFHADTVGLATTLLSMSALLSLLGLAGFDTTLVRFLPKSTHKNEQINNSIIITALASIILSGLFCALVPVISPKLAFVDHAPLYMLLFIMGTVFTTWNTLTNAALIAYRRTSFVVIINIIFSAVKMALPFVIRDGGPMTIFTFALIAQIVNVALSVAVLMRYFEYKPAIALNMDIIRKTRRFSGVVYLANIFNLIPDSILPLIVVNKLGAASAAYFYIAFTLANLLYTIAFATTQSLLAEASHDEEHIARHIRHSLVITTALLVPATLALIVLCPIILHIFGHTYSHGATSLLRILSLSSIGVMLYSALGAFFKLRHNLRAILLTTIVNAVVIISLSLVFVGPFGLNGIGWAWLIGTWASVGMAGWCLTAASTKSPQLAYKLEDI